MRNVIIARDAVAQEAGKAVLEAGGNAADAALAAMLAGATRATPASLLGSGVVLIAGSGAGAYFVDGRARAPGLGETKRGPAPEDPPGEWRAAVPGLLECVLATHGRFGSVSLGTIARTAVAALREAGMTPAVRARASLVEELPRVGLASLARLGLQQSILEVAGPAAGGVFTREDFAPGTAHVRPLMEVGAGEHLVLRAPEDAKPRHPPPAAPVVPIDAAVCADLHGVTACALWAIAPEAQPLPSATGLSLAALSNAPTRGVTRRKPGSSIEMPVPAALLSLRNRVWAGCAAAGEGDLVGARDAYLRGRLETVGVAYPAEREANEAAAGVILWTVRDEGDEVRSTTEAFLYR